ncbi:hypothetical protein AaE_010914 [Aphanomyces astaci]|uniref:Uncharacterized protein n=1 Tax=Aphanomyces astaci TaxID=112090 RepID=A0A6A4ZN52_APHAT|nr:hypothetical protein AaE_010914 [Aphanomyces astaci]
MVLHTSRHPKAVVHAATEGHHERPIRRRDGERPDGHTVGRGITVDGDSCHIQLPSYACDAGDGDHDVRRVKATDIAVAAALVEGAVRLKRWVKGKQGGDAAPVKHEVYTTTNLRHVV